MSVQICAREASHEKNPNKGSYGREKLNEVVLLMVVEMNSLGNSDSDASLAYALMLAYMPCHILFIQLKRSRN